MPTGFAALLLATPLFGLQLHAPALHAGPLDGSVPGHALHAMAWLSPAVALEVNASLPLATVDPSADAAADAAAEGRRFADAVRQRFETGQVHRALGIATWLSMTATVGLGFVQYYNLYGIGAAQDDNPCARGTAVFGQEQCWGTPLPHLVSAMTTSALYLATLSMSIGLLTNDPNEALSGTGSYSDRMRAHSVLALIHLAGMLAQSVIGVGLTNGWFGDRANDYESLRTVAMVHQVVGWTTWGALGVAGALMLF